MTIAAVALITAVGLALRLAGLGESLYGDELFTHRWSTQAALPDVIASVDRLPAGNLELNPPLFYVLAWISAKVGEPHVWLRMPSLLAGTLTIPASYALGARVAGVRAGMFAAALVALSPFAIFYSAEARGYALLALLITTSALVLLQAVRSSRWGWWVCWAVVAGGAVYTHYTAVFALAAETGWVAWTRRDRLRPLGFTLAAVALAYLPWLGALRADLDGTPLLVGPAIEPLTGAEVGEVVVETLVGVPLVPLRSVPGAIGLVLAGVALLALAAAVVQRMRTAPPLRSSEVWLIAWLALAAPVALLAYSLASTDLFVARNLMGTLPVLYVGFGVALAAAPRPLALVSMLAAGAAFVLGVVFALDPDHRRPPYREVARMVDRYAGPHEPVVVERISEAVPLAFTSGGLRLALERPHTLYEALVPGKKRAGIRAARARGLVIVRAVPPKPVDPVGDDVVAKLGLRPGPIRRFRGIDPIEVLVYERRSGKDEPRD
jgi:4-amino-4-deoxy-L-arabinose transferase-like glycosyltransferase